MRDSYECKLVQGWIEQLQAFKEKGDLEDSDYDTLEEIELNLNQYESAYGGIGDNLDQFLNRARKNNPIPKFAGQVDVPQNAFWGRWCCSAGPNRPAGQHYRL